jgi:hypothetical protein
MFFGWTITSVLDFWTQLASPSEAEDDDDDDDDDEAFKNGLC